ncbi:E3 ubiquitin-protein ligase RNFT1 [Rhinophrynus dorsalis]
MKHRPPHERRCSSKAKSLEENNPLVMQSNPGHTQNQPVSGGSSSTSMSLPLPRLPAEGSCSPGDVTIELHPVVAEDVMRSGSRRARPSIRGRSQGRPSHTHSHSHEASGLNDTNNTDSREQGTSISEVFHFYQWLEKSIPYILIFSAKLIVQHKTGISVGIGLLTTFLYANKCIVNQVFLREKCSKLQCIWLLVFLSCSSVLLYYAFYSQALYYSLIFLNPSLGPLQFWDALWVVGITDFVGKFFFMGLKCLVLLMPSFVMSQKCKGYWYMGLEECAQCYCTLVSTPVWIRYLIDYGSQDSGAEWRFGILLALLYLILKLLVICEQWRTSANIIRLLFVQPTYGMAATKRQCSEADEMCAICQAEFTKPTVLVCQHVFCEECISLWFNREKTCPLCRIVIFSQNHKWKDGATSLQLRLF